MGSTAILPAAAGGVQDAGAPCAEARAGSKAPPGQADGSDLVWPQQRHDEHQHHQQQQPASAAGVPLPAQGTAGYSWAAPPAAPLAPQDGSSLGCPQHHHDEHQQQQLASAAGDPFAAQTAAGSPWAALSALQSALEAYAAPEPGSAAGVGAAGATRQVADGAGSGSTGAAAACAAAGALGCSEAARQPAAAAVSATPAQLQAGTACALTVNEAAAMGSPLRYALRKWVHACGIAGDPGSVRVAELLPHYASLLSHLDRQHSSGQLAALTAFSCLWRLCNFLEEHQRVLQSSSVDYAAMLSSMVAAHSKYQQIVKVTGQVQSSLGGSNAGTSTAAAAQANTCGYLLIPAPWFSPPGVVSAPAAAAAAGSVEGNISAPLCQQLSAAAPPAAAAAGDDAADVAAARTAAAAAAAAAAITAGTACGAGSLQPAPSWNMTAFGLLLIPTATAAGAAAGTAATPAPLQGSAPHGLTVEEVSAAAAAAGKLLPRALNKWVAACGMGDLASVPVVELLPHYGKLLCLLDDLHSSRQLSAHTVYRYLMTLCSFLKDRQRELQSSSVDYAAMFNSMVTARSRYVRLITQQARDAQHTAAASAAAVPQLQPVDAAASAAVTTTNTAAAGAAAGFAERVTPEQWHGRQQLTVPNQPHVAEAAGLETAAAAAAAAGAAAAPQAVGTASGVAVAACAAASDRAAPAATPPPGAVRCPQQLDCRGGISCGQTSEICSIQVGPGMWDSRRPWRRECGRIAATLWQAAAAVGRAAQQWATVSSHSLPVSVGAVQIPVGEPAGLAEQQRGLCSDAGQLEPSLR